MQKIFFIIALLFLFVNSCKSSTGVENYDLIVLFDKPLGNYHIDTEIRQGGLLLGNITAIETTDTSTLIKIKVTGKLPLESKIEFKVVDLIDNAKIIINQSNSERYFENGDTLIGNINIPLQKIDTSATALDSMLEKVDPDVRRILQLDSVKKN